MTPYFDRDEAAALAVHGGQAAPSFDRRAVESHVSLIHDLAEGQDGVLILAAFEEGGQPNVQRFRIGDVANMVETIMGFEGHPRVNLYIPWAVMRRDLEPGRKGTEADVVAILAAVPDLDRDKGVKTELPVEAPYIVESSPGNFQPVYIFERPLAPADAKPALTALCDFVGGDSGTKDCSHVWRIPGTLNIPTKSKLARGRSSVPAPVSIKKPYDGRFISPAALLALALPPRLPNGHDTAPSDQRSFAEEARLRSALAVISAENRDIWLKVGAALHVLGARAVWDDWSKTSGKFDAADQDRVWASFHGERKEGVVTIATVYAWAKERGWQAQPFFEDRAGAQRDGQLPAPNPIKLLSYAEMTALPEGEFLIRGVIVRRAKNVLFGLSNAFKSFMATDMGGSVATGRSYHGMAVKKCPVIYVANEGAIAIGRKRIPAWMAAHEIPQSERANIYLVNVETILPNEISRNNLLAAIRSIVEPGEDFFLIIDVLRGTMTGSDSDDEAAAAWTSAAEILVKEGATILTLTHSPYSDDGRIRGSSHLWGSFEGRLHAEGEKEKRTCVVKVDRFKDHDSNGQWGFQLDEVEIEEHPGETSLVPRLDGEVKPKKGKVAGKLTARAINALDALRYALDEVGALPPTSNHIPGGVKTVTLTQWRAYFDRRTTLDKPDSRLKAFDAGTEKLKAEKVIGIWDVYAWIV